MSEQFKVGEVVVGHGFIRRRDLNGIEGEVLKYLGECPLTCLTTGAYEGIHPTYLVRWAGGVEHNVRQCNLKRKRPPRREIDTTVSWSECAWEPMHIKLSRAIEKAKEAA